MKLRNKKTGEIVTADLIYTNADNFVTSNYSLAELNENWEDYEEPKDNEYWYIDDLGRTQFSSEILDQIEGRPNNCMIRKLLGNYFETREEADKTVEKRKAWKRLKDKGFKFTGHFLGTEGLNIHYECNMKNDISDDLDLLFGGEE